MGCGASTAKVQPKRQDTVVAASMMAQTISEQAQTIKLLTKQMIDGDQWGRTPEINLNDETEEVPPPTERRGTLHTHQNMAVGAATYKRVKQGMGGRGLSTNAIKFDPSLSLDETEENAKASSRLSTAPTTRGNCSICGEPVLESQPRTRDLTTNQ